MLKMVVKQSAISILILVFLMSSCLSKREDDALIEVKKVGKKAVIDHHSYANFNAIRTTHLHLDLTVDFEQKILKGKVEHTIDVLENDPAFILDVKDLHIDKVVLDDDKEIGFTISEPKDFLGSALTIPVETGTKKVTVYYETTQGAEALMWLSPQQTSGKKHPFFFTQGEAILTRTWIPCQDSPSNRITYSASVKCDSNLLAIMSAENPQSKNSQGEYHFKMDERIPTYLIALSVGDLSFKSLSDRTGVYAEHKDVERCAKEFEDVEQMIAAAEDLYGPYIWGRYDILVMPPSFPFGGMENPRLTFATPTIIAGDKSLVSLIAHELAHSWSGNLVNNATWDDFWLNEGFTVYFENRIMEALYGKENADMLMSIEYEELMVECADILAGPHPEDTKLKLALKDRNPDDGMSSIAYVKGALLLQSLEAEVGRDQFDTFLRQYFAAHQFQTLTTEAFISYLDYFLLSPLGSDFDVKAWIYEKGIPDNAIVIKSSKFEAIDQFLLQIDSSSNVAELAIDTLGWTTQEWIYFIRELPNTGQQYFMANMDRVHNLKGCGNAEIMAEWYLKAIKNNYQGVRYEMAEFLVKVGRRKFLEPIYKALNETSNDREFARKVYKVARPNYHSITYHTIDDILAE